ncbi:hypothetical protein [Haloplanus salilacus]|uniref:hypothetical protein n=1 Tax=Haloplanus salilacus TaxID=2949994 RepID=UPI0030D566DE
MSDEPAELEIEAIERIDEGFELTHPDHEDPITIEYVTTDVDPDRDVVPDVASAARSYNEIRPDVEALFSELADDGLVSFLGDSGPDAETVRRWRREHPETVDRLDAVVDEFQTAWQQMDGWALAKSDFSRVYLDIVAIGLLIEGDTDELMEGDADELIEGPPDE